MTVVIVTLLILAVPYAAVMVAERVKERRREAEDQFHTAVVLPFRRRAARKRRA